MDDEGNRELARLKAIGDWMRDVGASELTLGDLRIKLAPRHPEAPGRAAGDPEEAEELSEEQRAARAEKTAEQEWNEKWRRITRSSGAPIPPFPGSKRVQ